MDKLSNDSSLTLCLMVFLPIPNPFIGNLADKIEGDDFWLLFPLLSVGELVIFFIKAGTPNIGNGLLLLGGLLGGKVFEVLSSCSSFLLNSFESFEFLYLSKNNYQTKIKYDIY